MNKKPTVLMILDGYGLNSNSKGNAVSIGKTPVMDNLMATCPFVEGYAELVRTKRIEKSYEHTINEYGAGARQCPCPF